MSEIRRLNPEEVVSWFAKHGFKPKRGITCRIEDATACALGTTAVETGCNKSEYVGPDWHGISMFRAEKALIAFGFDPDYVVGLSCGFEMGIIDKYGTNHTLGCVDGAAIAKLCFGEM